ncbi:hypothetical protein ASPWEDRAFT_698432 [Aspergillus wentii DTO 134E9]|uniref:Uncharacterized protein n=1 Tax=Aspergillus wentii DTO 134E9 TaxID=1073089 RepID=A0A1L9R9P4_ASPWE|nr:uncharacterized protein ASPWEDRAFT_698432 [Aspergillus wentii DTO 134E9]OJJ31640.1 hypothetical protein ASPWEDRAFT_698432 [Aspergillus wentii DTO 134E9]
MAPPSSLSSSSFFPISISRSTRFCIMEVAQQKNECHLCNRKRDSFWRLKTATRQNCRDTPPQCWHCKSTGETQAQDPGKSTQPEEQEDTPESQEATMPQTKKRKHHELAQIELGPSILPTPKYFEFGHQNRWYIIEEAFDLAGKLWRTSSPAQNNLHIKHHDIIESEELGNLLVMMRLGWFFPLGYGH